VLGPYLHKPLTGITFVIKRIDKIKTIFIVLVLPINSVFKHWLQNIILKNVGLTQKVIGNFLFDFSLLLNFNKPRNP
jgi:hypothetical protein